MGRTAVICVLLLWNFGYSQITSIPDPIFEQKLIDLGYDSTPINGEILTNSISSILTLDISWLGISSIQGIEGFTALMELNCNMNSIDTLDFSNNPNLVKLICSANQAAHLNITQNPNLDWLECGNNNFPTIDLTQNTVLPRIYAASGNLIDLDVSNNPNLIYLQLHFNQLASIDITNNPAIINFTCSSNQLTSLDFSQSYWLQYTQCQNNSIQELNFSNCAPLRYVECNGNLLNSLDFSQNENLKYLRCQNNDLSCLYLKNGFPYELDILNTVGNTSLTCIEVDDINWASTNHTMIDSTTTFSQNCDNACSFVETIELEAEDRFVIKIVDMLGVETEYRPNTLLIYIYNDGTTKKQVNVE